MKKADIIMAAIVGAIGIALAVIAFTVKSTVAKWIWGVLAVIVIGFTIYATIDAIIKNKRKPKDFADLLAQAMNSPDFAQKMGAAAKKRDLLFEGQRTSDPDFGYSASNSIMTSTVSRSEEYLGKLRTLNGKPFTWNRTGAYCMREVHGVENVMVDEYQLFLDGIEYKKVYICPYGHSSSYVPQGMELSE